MGRLTRGVAAPARSRYRCGGVLLVAAACILGLAACSSAPTAAPRPSVDVSAPSAVTTSPPDSPSSAPTGAALSTQLEELVRTMDGTMNDFTGAVLITRGDRVLMSHAYGVADEKHGTPVTLATRFRIGSITKQFTAMAILMLEHRGRLRLSDRVCRYLATCPAAWAHITVAELLTHTSGIPNYTSLSRLPAMERHSTTPERIIALVRNLPLDFRPGTRFEYSNSGYVLLGMVVEKVSGTSYEAFLTKNIFDRLRMSNTGYDHGHQGVAPGYSSAGHPEDPIDASVAFSAGALYSTVGDLNTWEHALVSGTLVPRSVVAELEKPRVSTDTGDHYGYGVLIDKTGDASNPVLKIWHTGGFNGSLSLLSHYPASDLVVVVLSNHGDTNMNGIDDKVRQLVQGA
jgi:CubicO group peptidase (beta-lactamase class C family)